MLLYVLDQVGVFAFSSYGAYRALQARMDLFGAFVCGGVVAMGGGTVREVVLHGTPIYLRDYMYVVSVVLGAAFATGFHGRFHAMDRYLRVLDGIGLATFALTGASRAADEGFGLGGMMLCAVLTGVGGGVICDLLTRRRLQLFHGDFYAVPALVMAVLAWIFKDHLTSPVIAMSLIALVFTLQMSALRLGWTLWCPLPPAADAEADTVRMSRASLLGGGWNDETVVLPRVRSRRRLRLRR